MNKIFTLFDSHPEVFTAFSTRSDGSMHVLNESDSRIRFLRAFGIEDKSVGLILMHGSKAVRVNEDDAGRIIPNTDALLTSVPNLYLNITVADCLPVFFYDPVKKVVALAHAGWRGLENGVLKNTFAKMTKEYATNPQDLLVGIGPCICKEHYQIQEDLVEKFKEYPEAIIRNDKGVFLDLTQIAKTQLLALGVLEENIETSNECTFGMPAKYFSYRRDKPKTVEPMIAIIGIK